MAIMMAEDSATARCADQGYDRAKERSDCSANSSGANSPGANSPGANSPGANSPGAMALQSDRGYDAAPQMFVRLTGSHLARPRASRESRSVVVTG
jgi:hypothetical protein